MFMWKVLRPSILPIHRTHRLDMQTMPNPYTLYRFRLCPLPLAHHSTHSAVLHTHAFYAYSPVLSMSLLLLSSAETLPPLPVRFRCHRL